MAEFDFEGVWEDSQDYIQQLVLMHRFTFVVDMWYREHVPFQFTFLTPDVERILTQRHRVYMYSDDYSLFPPAFGQPDQLGNMMIEPVRSGPALDLTFPYEFEKKGKPCLGGGVLFYQPVYQDPGSGALYKPPEVLKRAFKEVRTLLQRGMVKRYMRSQTVTTEGVIKPAIRTLWIGKRAVDQLDSGSRGILFAPIWDKDWMTGADFAKTREELLPLVDEYA